MGRQGTILVVDDEAGIRTLLARVLGRAGHEVVLAENGEDGVAKARESAPHVAVLDMKMPDIDGVEVLRRIKEHDASVQGIVVTAHSTVENAVEAMKLGAFDYIRKPFDNDELLLTIDKALELVSLQREVNGLREQLGARDSVEAIIGQAPAMERILQMVQTVAASKSTVLICGESGTGKELVARAIHHHSPRRKEAFIKVNCAAISEELLESELFGHEKGSFTGAATKHEGKFELANNGTILLDEVSEMSPKLQAKLLRVLQEREVDRVGGKHPIPIDVRVLATTNRNLDEEIDKGTFREDLYYRLNVVAITLPPLRERPGDIPLLADFFLRRYSAETNRRFTGFAPEAMDVMTAFRWDGNVRQMQNAVERAVVLAPAERIQVDDLPPEIVRAAGGKDVRAATGSGDAPAAVPVGSTLEDMERQLILATLDEEGWNRTRAAERLGVSIRTIRNKLNLYAEQGFIDTKQASEAASSK